MYRTKIKDRIGPLKTDSGELIESGEDISRTLNDYFLSVFTQENLAPVPERVQVYKGEKKREVKGCTYYLADGPGRDN